MSNFRPMTHAEFEDAKRANHVGLIVKCSFCGEPFSPNNVKSVPGWKETQISGMCETCFDALFEGAGIGKGEEETW